MRHLVSKASRGFRRGPIDGAFPALYLPGPASTIRWVSNGASVGDDKESEGPFEGDERLSEVRRKSKPGNRAKDGAGPGGGERRPGAPRKNQGDVGKVLRSVYDTTLNEDIPEDFLDLLGKLD